MQYDILMPCFPILDVIIPMEDEFPIHAGESKIAHRMTDEAGGPANIFFAASRMGASVLPVGTVGSDAHGRFLLQAYAAEGIDISHLQIRSGYSTPQALCINTPSGRHAFITMIHGAPPADAGILRSALEQARSLALTGYLLASPDVGYSLLPLLRYARELQRDIFFDPGPLIPGIPEPVLCEALAAATVLIVNDEEAALLTGGGSMEAMASGLSQRTGGAVVIKAGARGCYTLHRGGARWHAGFSVPLVDTTGAGDSFMGAFMHGWLSGWGLETASILANAAGAVKVSKPGSGRQVPTYREVARLLRESGYTVPAVNDPANRFISLALPEEN